MPRRLVVLFRLIIGAADIIIQFGIVRIGQLGVNKMAQRFFIGPALIGRPPLLDVMINITRPGLGGDDHGEYQQKQRSHRAPTPGQQHFRPQAQQGQGQKPLETVLPNFLLTAFQGGLFHRSPNLILINHLQVHITGHGSDIKAAGEGRHLTQGLLAQTGQHNLPLPVFFKPPGLFGHRRALLSTDADTKQSDLFFGRPAGGLQRIRAGGLFTVCNQDDGLVGSVFFVEPRNGLHHGLAQVGTPYRQHVRRKGV